MKHLSVMLKPASSACNLRCKYCFYADLAGKRDTFSFGRMSEDTTDRIVEQVRRSMEPGDSVTFAFQGGEPTLIGLDWFRRFVSRVEDWGREVRADFALQTNGTFLDDEWCEFLHEKNFLVGISIDAMPKCHNSCRVDIEGRGTYRQVDRAVQIMRRHRVEFNVLCTLTSEIARHPQQVWNWIKENDFRFVQFTPCLDELDDVGASRYAIHPRKFASFYIPLFRLWLEDFRKGQYRSIKFFDDVINLLAYGMPTACGIHGKCQCQMVVESDGEAYPCDFYCLDQYRMGKLSEHTVQELMKSDSARRFLTRPRRESELCTGCRYRKFCGGGCERMRYEIYGGPGDTFCGYQAFLDEALPDLQKIAAQQRAMRGMR